MPPSTGPLRIYQWGSLVHTGRFSEISDIDIAVEGMSCDEKTLAAIRSLADSMTGFHVDLVVMERLDPGKGRPHPAFRTFLRQVRGRTSPE